MAERTSSGAGSGGPPAPDTSSSSRPRKHPMLSSLAERSLGPIERGPGRVIDDHLPEGGLGAKGQIGELPADGLEDALVRRGRVETEAREPAGDHLLYRGPGFRAA